MSDTNAEIETRLLRLPDGRDLAFCDFGDASGYPIFYAHGSPGSRLEGEIYHAHAMNAGFRIIALDRPGFGRSSLQSHRRLIDYPKDVIQLAEHLGIRHFGSIGHSGGGAYSLICRYACPRRTRFAISLSGYTNFGEIIDAEKLLKTKADRLSVSLSLSHPRLFRLLFKTIALGIRYAPKFYCNSLSRGCDPADRAILSDPAIRKFLIHTQREALIQGGVGAALDAAILYSDWGASLKNIPGNVTLFHGSQDRLVPIEYARHLAASIPECTLHVLEGQGHLYPWRQQEFILQSALKFVPRR